MSSSSLAFFAPGLLHQLGNQLFAAQGGAQLLPDAAAEQRSRILAAIARGGESLRLLRALLGDPSAPCLPLTDALLPLVEAARVSLRERGHLLQVAAPVRGPKDGAASPVVATATVLAWTAEALSRLADSVPAGVTGTFSIATATESGAAVVAVRFARAAGSLPFPLDRAAVRQELMRHLAPGDRSGPACRLVPDGLELAFPMAVPGVNQEA